VYENLSSLMVPSIYVGEESNDTTISVRLKKDKFLRWVFWSFAAKI